MLRKTLTILTISATPQLALADIGLGVGVSVGDGSVASADVGASVGDGSVASADVGASIGDGSVASADVGASVGDGSVASAGVGASIGDGSVASADVGTSVGDGSTASIGGDATIGGTTGAGDDQGGTNTAAPRETTQTPRTNTPRREGVSVVGTSLISRDGVRFGTITRANDELICTSAVCVRFASRPVLTAEGLVVNVDSSALRQ